MSLSQHLLQKRQQFSQKSLTALNETYHKDKAQYQQALLRTRTRFHQEKSKLEKDNALFNEKVNALAPLIDSLNVDPEELSVKIYENTVHIALNHNALTKEWLQLLWMESPPQHANSEIEPVRIKKDFPRPFLLWESQWNDMNIQWMVESPELKFTYPIDQKHLLGKYHFLPLLDQWYEVDSSQMLVHHKDPERYMHLDDEKIVKQKVEDIQSAFDETLKVGKVDCSKGNQQQFVRALKTISQHTLITREDLLSIPRISAGSAVEFDSIEDLFQRLEQPETTSTGKRLHRVGNPWCLIRNERDLDIVTVALEKMHQQFQALKPNNPTLGHP